MRIPDLFSLDLIKRWVVKRHVDSGLEGLVEDADAVGGQEKNTLIVFKSPQENCSR